MTMKPGNKSSKPVCWWCGISTGFDSGYRGSEPLVVALPSGVVVCSPGCPERPEGASVWKAGEENFVAVSGPSEG